VAARRVAATATPSAPEDVPLLLAARGSVPAAGRGAAAGAEEARAPAMATPGGVTSDGTSARFQGYSHPPLEHGGVALQDFGPKAQGPAGFGRIE
jgi:hypothetical protein